MSSLLLVLFRRAFYFFLDKAMAQRIDSNDDDEFEILDELTAMDGRQTFEVVGGWNEWK